MDYGLSSGAFFMDASNAFIKYFDYGGGSISEFRSSYTNSEWENMVYEELGKGNPILYGANGHAFVVDGHDGNGYVHINWGWTGTYDGFFLLTASPAINEEPMGGYFTGQEAVFGAMPNGAIPRLTTQGLTLTSNDVIEDLSSCPSIPVTLSMTVANLTGETHSFEQAIGLYKQGKLQTIVSQLDNINNMVTGTTKNQDVSFELESTLSQGVYSLIPVSREMGSNQWRMNGNPDQLITLSIYGGGAKLTVGVPEEEGDIITFACDEVRDVCVKYWDVNGDGALSKEEAAAVTSLSLRFLTNQSITSFDEFQYFTGVTTIAAVEFYNCPNLTSITFPPSITTIEERAFSTCNLKHLVIPKNVTSIGDKAFDSNYYMETIRVEAGNTVYDSRNNCNAIIETATNKLIKGCNNTTIPEDVVTIGSSAFSYCKNMKSIQVPNSVTNIEERAFLGCSNMLSITIPEGLTSILTDTFYGCESLAGIVIPSSVTSIGSYAFYGCSALPSVTIPEGVTNIGNSAFFKCTGLASVTIPSSVDSIGASAFSGCTGLASISLPNGLVSIGTSAFADCTGLTSVRIPNSVSSMGANPFHGCYNMQSLVVDANNARYKSVSNNSAILDIVTNTLVTGTASTIIPEGVVAIGSYAFYGCRGLTSITLPSSVTSIGSTAFRDCTSLQAIDIPSHVNSIGQDAFRNCRSLTSFVIPSSVTIIDQGVFLDCSGLKSVTIPYGVTSIGYDAFTYCTRLTSIKIPSSVKKIDSYSFMRCTSLTEITIPSSVTSIGTGAFQSCTKLASIKSYITRVFKTGKNAFNNCVNATLYVPKGLVDTYKSTTDWNKINFIKEIPVSYDVNGDGSIDISDVVCIVNRVLGASSDEDDSYDVNTDGKVDINDVVILVNVILGK